jgi:hypothetical protein
MDLSKSKSKNKSIGSNLSAGSSNTSSPAHKQRSTARLNNNNNNNNNNNENNEKTTIEMANLNEDNNKQQIPDRETKTAKQPVGFITSLFNRFRKNSPSATVISKTKSEKSSKKSSVATSSPAKTTASVIAQTPAAVMTSLSEQPTTRVVATVTGHGTATAQLATANQVTGQATSVLSAAGGPAVPRPKKYYIAKCSCSKLQQKQLQQKLMLTNNINSKKMAKTEAASEATQSAVAVISPLNQPISVTKKFRHYPTCPLYYLNLNRVPQQTNPLIPGSAAITNNRRFYLVKKGQQIGGAPFQNQMIPQHGQTAQFGRSFPVSGGGHVHPSMQGVPVIGPGGGVSSTANFPFNPQNHHHGHHHHQVHIQNIENIISRSSIKYRNISFIIKKCSKTFLL